MKKLLEVQRHGGPKEEAGKTQNTEGWLMGKAGVLRGHHRGAWGPQQAEQGRLCSMSRPAMSSADLCLLWAMMPQSKMIPLFLQIKNAYIIAILETVALLSPVALLAASSS